jgi:ribosomal protein S18 acetylase RimI-like enzyme
VSINPTERAPLAVRPARPADVPVLARLMREDFDGSRLTHLGPRFVTLLHRHMATSAHCICRVAEDAGRITGYIAVAPSTRAFYRDFVLRKGLLAACLVLPRMLQPAQLRTVLKGLTYFPQSPQADPAAEIIIFVIDPAARRSGVGSALFHNAVEALQARGIQQLKIMTAVDNDAANAFYRRHGSRLVRSEPFYRDTRVNVYVRDCA